MTTSTALACMLAAAGMLVYPQRALAPRLSRIVHRTGNPVSTVPTERQAPLEPLALDLYAACLASGLGPAIAAQAVSRATATRFFERAAELLGIGIDPSAAWATAASNPAEESFARAAQRSHRTGTQLAAVARNAAQALREEEQHAAIARAEKASVLIAAPLGLCFLPAFLCLGIIPVVIGLATQLAPAVLR
ncbi:type II secretion system F family protein [Hoyosella sp. G463]|uniref:Type II secretion system F family protein n=1 Tax=Lolliginicoccus lacisalsi TaxID=2742202 RepID=A0A927PMT2_9ACTN|nr:type II secretion system F family protein [Lolliginicoccus lacisalsi]MBD8507259.1 type II secretion system F family protein [Lolliginicoccus lacisalsi]